jgi:two-component sensor histidine kinase
MGRARRNVAAGLARKRWPPVAPPTEKGFGSRLLEELVVRDLGGDTKLDFDVSGVRCGITASL